MIEYRDLTPPQERLGSAVAEALAAGISAEEMITIIATALSTQNGDMGKARENQEAATSYDLPDVPDASTVFNELPEGLITIPEAAEKHGIPKGTILTWVRLGRVTCQGTVKKGQGAPLLVVRESELLECKDAPKSKDGGPPNDAHIPPELIPLVEECEEFQALNPLAVYNELPPGLITLSDAARKYGLNHMTIRNWVRKGALKTYGRLKGSAKGGGFILINEADLRVCRYLPKDKGGRPKKT